jgi:hypothetical protein
VPHSVHGNNVVISATGEKGNVTAKFIETEQYRKSMEYSQLSLCKSKMFIIAVRL